MSLGSLGVSTSEERVYRFLLRHPGADPAGYPAGAPAEAIGRLQELGLVRVAADGTALAAEPQAALDKLMRRTLADLNSELDRITSASSALRSCRAEAGALLIRQPGIVATLVDLLEHIWARSADLEPDPSELSAEEREVLDLLNRFGKDEAPARALGVSVRTFRAL